MDLAVFDSSALLCVIWEEQGRERALEWIEGAVVSAVNLTEVCTKLLDRGMTEEGLHEILASLAIKVIPFDRELALEAALLRRQTRAAGLSLGDRACLATARALGATAVTADRAWSRIEADVPIEIIR